MVKVNFFFLAETAITSPMQDDREFFILNGSDEQQNGREIAAIPGTKETILMRT